MRLLLAMILWTLQGNTATANLSELRARADTIIEQRDAREITTEQARRKVQLLLNDLVQWAEESAVRLEIRSRIYTEPELDPKNPLTVNRCQLFYEEDRDELCPIDLSRSELWSGTVLFCRYLCE